MLTTTTDHHDLGEHGGLTKLFARFARFALGQWGEHGRITAASKSTPTLWLTIAAAAGLRELLRGNAGAFFFFVIQFVDPLVASLAIPSKRETSFVVHLANLRVGCWCCICVYSVLCVCVANRSRFNLFVGR